VLWLDNGGIQTKVGCSHLNLEREQLSNCLGTIEASFEANKHSNFTCLLRDITQMGL
jgi:hypothetical protein